MMKTEESVVKVLIVEEVPAMRRLLRSMLEGLELLVHECHDGRETLAACAAQQPNWVLLDLSLSDTDALAATRQIRLAHPLTKVVIVSDDDNLLLREAARSAGACDYVLKENLLTLRQRFHRAAD
jgi:two-component system, OmpR family, KDP operon response regulator KdpE